MLSIDNVKNLKQTKLPVIIYGADLVGKVLYNACKHMGIKVECFCDDSFNKINLSRSETVYGLDVIDPVKIPEKYADAHFIVSSTYIRDIIHHLNELNFDKWYDCSILRNYDYWEDQYTDSFGKRNVSKAFVDFTVKACLTSQEGYLNKDKLFARCVDLVITEKCSMKCSDCSNLMQYYLSPQTYNYEDVLKSIDYLFSCVDEVYEMRVIGGEPMLNKDIHLIVDRLVKEEKVRRIVIYTNATIPLKERQMSAFKNKKVLFLITDYDKLSRNISKLVTQLKDNNIAFDRKPVDGWTDSGFIKHHERTNEDNQKIFDYCCAKNNVTLMAGHNKLYNCPFAANADALQAIPEDPNDYVDISKGENNLKENVRKMIYREKFVGACDFCNGRSYSMANIVPAIQVKKPIPYKIYDRTTK
jgi:organic radical activating enzyme